MGKKNRKNKKRFSPDQGAAEAPEEEEKHLPCFLAPQEQPGFENAFKCLRAIEKQHSDWAMSCKVVPGVTGILLQTKDEITAKRIAALTHVEGKPVNLTPWEPSESHMVLLHYPVNLDLKPILDHPAVLRAKRFTAEHRTTTPVDVVLKGWPRKKLDLGKKRGSYALRTYIPEPKRCYTCQKYGHHQTQCSSKPKCGVCSEEHDTKQCIQLHKDNGETTATCPNCFKNHHAWNRKCSARRSAVKSLHREFITKDDFIADPAISSA